MTSSANHRSFSLRSVAVPVYLPTLLFTIGEMAIAPALPSIALQMHAGLALAGFIAGLLAVGVVFGDLPSGWLVARIGERNAIILASGLATIGALVCALAPIWQILALGVFIIGVATSIIALARHAFLTTFVPLAWRARSLSLLAGSWRAGFIIGPLLSAGLILLTNNNRISLWLCVFFSLATMIVMFFIPEPTQHLRHIAPHASHSHRELTAGEEEAEQEMHGLFRTIWVHRGVLLRLGSAAAIFGGLRAARNVVLPLWGVAVGMPEAEIALVMSVTAAVDFAFFYSSGQIMDRWGRLWSAVPALILMTASMWVLAFSGLIGSGNTWIWLSAVLFGLGNGVGAGVLLTFGSDTAPPQNPAPFLGAFRFTNDVGAGLAPVGISVITAAFSLGAAAGTFGLFGILGVFLVVRFVPRYIKNYRGKRTASAVT